MRLLKCPVFLVPAVMTVKLALIGPSDSCKFWADVDKNVAAKAGLRP